jgi:hypothetical protein
LSVAETDEVFNSPADREAVIGAFFVFIPAAAMCVAGAAAHAFDALSLIVLGLVFGSLIWAMVLITRTAAFIELSPEQITVGLAPFWKTRLRRREVTQIKVAQVDTYGEYGGWGIKGSAGSSRGRLYSVGGDTAVRIEMRDGRAYVVAFKDSKAVERVRRALHAES